MNQPQSFFYQFKSLCGKCKRIQHALEKGKNGGGEEYKENKRHGHK